MLIGQENIDSPAFDYMSQIDALIDNKCDEIANRTSSYYLPFQTNLIANQTNYCSSAGLYKIMSAYCLDQNGNALPVLTVIADYDLDKVNGCWRTFNQTGQPQYLVDYGASSFALWPLPNYSIANGINLYGWAVPGKSGTDGTSIWASPTSTCPLAGSGGDWAIAYSVMSLRAMMFVGQGNVPAQTRIAQANYFQAQADAAIGRLEQQMATYSAAQQFRDIASACRRGGYTGAFGWWGGGQ